MENDLKPCPNPWCTSDNRRYLYVHSTNGRMRIECDCGVGAAYADDRASAVAAWNDRPSEWISVDERLPESGSRVLIAFHPQLNKRVNDAWYNPLDYPEHPWRDGLGSGDGPSVSHWMPMPAPPTT